MVKIVGVILRGGEEGRGGGGAEGLGCCKSPGNVGRPG